VIALIFPCPTNFVYLAQLCQAKYPPHSVAGHIIKRLIHKVSINPCCRDLFLNIPFIIWIPWIVGPIGTLKNCKFPASLAAPAHLASILPATIAGSVAQVIIHIPQTGIAPCRVSISPGRISSGSSSNSLLPELLQSQQHWLIAAAALTCRPCLKIRLHLIDRILVEIPTRNVVS